MSDTTVSTGVAAILAKYRNPLGIPYSEMQYLPGWLLEKLDSDDVRELRSTASLCSDRRNIELLERRVAQIEAK